MSSARAGSLVRRLKPPSIGEEVNLGERIDSLESRFEQVEPTVRAFVDEPGRFDRLRREVEWFETARPHPGNRPGLYGMAVGVKDVFAVDGLPTRAGSRLPPEILARPEGACVTALRRAGALIVGKTVTTEFAYFAPGPTRNPHDLERTPGGSSSGSAAAVAAGLASLGIGTQTIGSILRPASFCGVVGFKPSFGRVPTTGLIPLAPSFDHVGFLAPDCDTLRRAAEVCVGGWRTDRSAATASSPRPLRLGVFRGAYLEQVSKAGRDRFETVIQTLNQMVSQAVGNSAGEQNWTFVDRHGFDSMERVDATHRSILAAEAAQVHREWLNAYHPLYDPRTVELIEDGLRIDAGGLATARVQRDVIESQMRKWSEMDEVDLWLSPAAPGPAPEGLESTGDPSMNRLWTQLGWPAISIPIPNGIDGLPFGLQIVGVPSRMGDEALVARAAHLAEILAETSTETLGEKHSEGAA